MNQELKSLRVQFTLSCFSVLFVSLLVICYVWKLQFSRAEWGGGFECSLKIHHKSHTHTHTHTEREREEVTEVSSAWRFTTGARQDAIVRRDRATDKKEAAATNTRRRISGRGVTVKIGEFEYLWTHCGAQMVFLWDAKYGTNHFFYGFTFCYICMILSVYDSFRVCNLFLIFIKGNTGSSPTVYLTSVALISCWEVVLWLFWNLLLFSRRVQCYFPCWCTHRPRYYYLLIITIQS